MIARLTLALALFITVGSLAWAGFDEGYAASERGDFETALRQWRPIAEQGDATAQYNLGVMYEKGWGVAQDYAEAVKWFRLAAEQGNATARNNLGAMHEKGRGVPQDYAEAVKWYRLAAEQGVATAQYNLGAMYENGWGVAQDYAEAVKWFRLAAEQGDATAQNNLGAMYGEGRGVAQDYAEAVKWFRLAAEQGVATAQNNLGAMYENGWGFPKDYVRAHKWYNLATSNHTPGQQRQQAAQNRDRIAAQLTQNQLVRAQAMAREWNRTIEDTARRPTERTIAPVGPSRKLVRQVQEHLARLGYNVGAADGVPGPRTWAAVRAYQADNRLTVTGAVSEELLSSLSAHVSLLDELNSSVLQEERKLKKTSGGSGFTVSREGHYLTNHHVIEGCAEVRMPPGKTIDVISSDRQNDLALLKGPVQTRGVATFRQGRGVRQGETVLVVGYPLRELLSSDVNVTAGTVSALAGPGDDRRLIQITAPVQLGNSGGPLVDLAGNVVGVVVGKLNALKIAVLTGDIPQNVNFAVSALSARAFLDAYDIPYETASSDKTLEPADVAAKARGYTVSIECWK